MTKTIYYELLISQLEAFTQVTNFPHPNIKKLKIILSICKIPRNIANKHFEFALEH